MGQSARIFKGEMKAMKDDNDATAGTADSTAAQAAPLPQTQAAPVDPAKPGSPDATS